ncbi:hypothetical protein L345_01659, partial [Ophiophagus hannah]
MPVKLRTCVHCNTAFTSAVSLSNHLRAYARKKSAGLLTGTGTSLSKVRDCFQLPSPQHTHPSVSTPSLLFLLPCPSSCKMVSNPRNTSTPAQCLSSLPPCTLRHLLSCVLLLLTFAIFLLLLMMRHTCLGLASHYEKGVGGEVAFGFSFLFLAQSQTPPPSSGLYMRQFLCQQLLDGLGLASHCEKGGGKLLSAPSLLLESQPIQELFAKKHSFQRFLGGEPFFHRMKLDPGLPSISLQRDAMAKGMLSSLPPFFAVNRSKKMAKVSWDKRMQGSSRWWSCDTHTVVSADGFADGKLGRSKDTSHVTLAAVPKPALVFVAAMPIKGEASQTVAVAVPVRPRKPAELCGSFAEKQRIVCNSFIARPKAVLFTEKQLICWRLCHSPKKPCHFQLSCELLLNTSLLG